MKSFNNYIIEKIKLTNDRFNKSFGIKDFGATNPNINLNKILNIKKMKDYIANNSDIIVFSNDTNARVFSKLLCTIEFTIKEWEILSDSPNPEDVDLLLKRKLKPFIIEKTVNDYTFLVDEEQILISVEPGVSPKELFGEYTYETTILWFNNNFEF
jgi:hypothetical protein